MNHENFYKEQLEKLFAEKKKIEEKIFLLKQEEERERILRTHKEQMDNAKKEFLLQNSVPIKEAYIEIFDGEYFIVAKDDTFHYVIRLDSDQAEHLADELDYVITQEHKRIQQEFSIVNNMFKPVIDQVIKKPSNGKH